ncbi:MAG: hypothetical protein NC131_12650 [Roseburia sp.]|nr:hypothetical protein [Roseburia sp.]
MANETNSTPVKKTVNFLEYAQTNQCNIIPKEEFEALVQETFNIIATNLSKSLGPLGSSATILDGMMTEATKDGHSILSKYTFHNRYKRMIYNLILAPCTRMNNTVGDGTTTAIALTNALFNRYQKRKARLETLYRLPRQFNRAWDDVIEDLSRRVREKATPIESSDYDTIYNIAYVTSNGNKEISKAIAETYKASGSPAIKQKDSPTNKSYIKPIDGFDFPATLIDEIFARNEDGTANEKNIYVMIFDHKIEGDFFNNILVKINKIMRARGKKLLILAPSYDSYMCNTVLEQHVRTEMSLGGINMITAQYRMGKLEKYQLEDLAIILGAKVINEELANGLSEAITNGNSDAIVEKILEDPKYKFYQLIGSAKSALLSCDNGCIFQPYDLNDNDRYQEALRHAERDLNNIIAQTDHEKSSYSSKIYEANARVLQLKMKNYIYYIGADSALQKQIIWDAVEDVIKCVRSAIKSGVVPGCQLSIISACDNAINEILDKYPDVTLKDMSNVPNEDRLRLEIISIIADAVEDVYRMILHGPDGMGIIKTINRWQYTENTDEAVAAIQKEAFEKVHNIIKDSYKNNQVFDLETLEFNSNIITSAETDTMVLSAASELVKILISGNQCIYRDSEIDDAHDENVNIRV